MQPITRLSGLTEKYFEVLDNIEYRRIQTWEDMEEVGRLRAAAYKTANIMPVAGDKIIDDADFDDHAYVFGIYYDEQLISTVRIHHVTPDHSLSSSAKVFPSIVRRFLDAGMTIIDPTRLAGDLALIHDLPGAGFLTMRIATMASDFFDVDRCLSLVKPQHAAFYKRMFDFTTLMPPTTETGPYSIPLTLMASDIRGARHWIYKRYPFLQARPYEMRMLFGNLDEAAPPVLTVRPTAKFAARAYLSS